MRVRLKNDEITTEAILESLRNHLTEQRPVTLLNTYHGVPISYEADVAMIHPEYVGLIIHPYQAVCIKHERRTYIKSKALPSIIRAVPASIDYTNQVVLLKNFQVPKSISVDLKHSWVAPEKAVIVEIGSEGGMSFNSKLSKIAVLDNNRIRVVLEVPQNFPFNRFDDIELAFRLNEGGDLLQVMGVMYSFVKIRNRNQKKLEVEGKAAMGDEITILAYIARREDQIMGAVDKAYKKLRKVKKGWNK